MRNDTIPPLAFPCTTDTGTLDPTTAAARIRDHTLSTAGADITDRFYAWVDEGKITVAARDT